MAANASRSPRDALHQMQGILSTFKDGGEPQERALALLETIVRSAAAGLEEEMQKPTGQRNEDIANGQARLLDSASRTVATVVGAFNKDEVPSKKRLAAVQFKEIDPRAVFLRIGDVVEKGGRGEYHAESLGSDLVVRLVRRYLADYRHVLQGDPACRAALVGILNAFVGWPKGRELSYHLDEIFR